MTHAPHSFREIRHIFIVEDHPIFRNGLADLIEQEKDLKICGSAQDVSSAFNAIVKLMPDLVILDLALKTSNGMDLLEQLKQECEHIPVLILSTYDEQIYAERCLRAGAMGYINKKEASDSVINAIRQIFNGNVFLSESMTGTILNKFHKRTDTLYTTPVEVLTNRELEVFNLIGNGMVPSAIADRLHLSAKTVYSHTERIKDKLGIKHSPELVRFAALWVENGMGRKGSSSMPYTPDHSQSSFI